MIPTKSVRCVFYNHDNRTQQNNVLYYHVDQSLEEMSVQLTSTVYICNVKITLFHTKMISA